MLHSENGCFQADDLDPTVADRFTSARIFDGLGGRALKMLPTLGCLLDHGKRHA